MPVQSNVCYANLQAEATIANSYKRYSVEFFNKDNV